MSTKGPVPYINRQILSQSFHTLSVTTDCCRILSTLRMWPIPLVVREVLDFLLCHCIITIQNFKVVCSDCMRSLNNYVYYLPVLTSKLVQWSLRQVACSYAVATVAKKLVHAQCLIFTGGIDSSGIEFFYTSTPRQHDAGILSLGHRVNRFMIIPPNAGSYSIMGKCSAECTSQVWKSKILFVLWINFNETI